MEINNLGFIFELGYNIGILSFLVEKKKENIAEINEEFLLFIENILSNKDYKQENIYIRYTSDIVDENSKRITKRHIDYLLFKGQECGRSFCREFIESKVGKRRFKLEYFQADFHDLLKNKNSKDEENTYYKNLIKIQLNLNLSEDEIDMLMGKGETFKADSILLISSRDKYYLCVVDNAISLRNIIDYENINEIKNKYSSFIFNKRLKSSFSNLAIDTKGICGLNISQSLCNYILALHKKDKPLFKMIQAGSYGYSFISLLTRKNYINENNIESICIAGYTDDDVSSINISKEDIKMLGQLDATYKDVLKYFNTGYKESDRQNKESNLEDKILDVYTRIRTNFKKIFNIKSDEFKDIFSLKEGLNTRKITEEINNYQNTAGPYLYYNKEFEFRSAHAEEVRKYIGDKEYKLLFLTGNPGIGKTTAIINYLKEEESYIFMYVSPRTQVNRDIEQKFLNKEGILYDNNAVYLTANGNDETFLDGKKVNIVNFNSNTPDKYSNIDGPIKFLDNKRKRDFSKNINRFKSKTSKEFCEADNNNLGVLNRLTKAVNYIIDNNLSNKIISTAAVQSLKSIADGKTTAIHFKNIFNTIINRTTESINLNEFEKLANNYKNIIFMIDEITGDESGVEFLQELIGILFNKLYNKLPDEYKDKINFKIIVADASITDIEVIKSHLSNRESESNKIYYKIKENKEEQALESKEFLFRKKYKSRYINANSFPASKLKIDYKLYINVKEIDEGDKLLDGNIRKYLNETIAMEAIDLILSKSAKQVIVYIQDLKRLEEIIFKMCSWYKENRGKDFVLGEDYIKIDSSISEEERKNIFKVKDKVKIVLMTSSASRGISFPNATSILVDMPKFDIEKNIMEILQLIYRGRGDKRIDTEFNKSIRFFIEDTIYYKKDNDLDIIIKEATINIMTLLIILKISILTRIKGSAKLGKNNIALVPIGGKGISANEDMFIENTSALIKNLKKEINKDQSKEGLKKICDSIMKIFSSIKIETNNSIYNIELDQIKTEFYNAWKEGIFKLINFKPFHNTYILGDLAIFKVKNQMNSSSNLIHEIVINDNEKNNTIKKMFAIAEKDTKLSDTIRNQLRKTEDALDYFIKNSEEVSMSLIDKSKTEDRFVAIPIITPFILDILREYNEEMEEKTLKDILEMYVKSYYEIGSILPITNEYRDVPFITFKSCSLLDIRKKMFSDKYMFCSSEINLLNLILID